ncbi:hypothetical protein Q1W73_09350 [Asticcacaulis sp. ZE23SCel15]|uniref:hypothetical protein n=1 Tax=Asticcacaulis sp. ZE23SCel15 TaxID=3059027 RepID=UPI00265F0084|nr:hypothetical protein [Asticcacaulis sp. ZE23SCel15]WKL55909.1 hypothetical protein Q1W73_09350 [Asticcacaulis sp. ZE23SCel15]
MKRTVKIATGLVVVFMAISGTALAQPYGNARLVSPPQYGQIKMVLGAARLVAQPAAECSAEGKPWVSAPCFDPVFARLRQTGEPSATVVGLFRPALDGEIMRGTYGYDFALFDVTKQGAKFNVAKIDLQTSAVRAPKDCFSLPDEDVFYRMDRRGTVSVAQEMLTVVCGGAPKRTYGGYMAQGASLPAQEPAVGQAPNLSGPLWVTTEKRFLKGERRYLAIKDGDCPKDQRVDGDYCAPAAVAAFAGNAELKELDLIASEHRIEEGAALTDKDIDQWVLKRKGKGPKQKLEADDRWFAHSNLQAIPGCTPIKDTTYRVVRHEESLYVQEEVLAQCGAPPAPSPFATYEAYGDERPVAQFKPGCPKDLTMLSNICFDEVVAYMETYNHQALDVVVLNRPARDRDYLFSGGPVSYDMAKVKFYDGSRYEADRKSSYNSRPITLPGCSQMPNAPSEAKGWVLTRRGRTMMAVEYQWFSCPVN